MIVGKSLTALCGGGLKPEIRVTAKAGALLNLHYKDSSIILQFYQLGAKETQHTFVVSVSDTAYVVDDVTNSANVEVLVDTVAQYSVDIPYNLYLYKDGDECEDITGGWEGLPYTVSGSDVNGMYGGAITLTKNSKNMVAGQSQMARSGAVYPKNIIDLSPYSKLCWEGSANSSNWVCFIRVASNKVDYYNSIAEFHITGQTRIELDISGIKQSAYPIIVTGRGFADSEIPNVTVTTTKMWLE